MLAQYPQIKDALADARETQLTRGDHFIHGSEGFLIQQLAGWYAKQGATAPRHAEITDLRIVEARLQRSENPEAAQQQLDASILLIRLGDQNTKIPDAPGILSELLANRRGKTTWLWLPDGLTLDGLRVYSDQLKQASLRGVVLESVKGVTSTEDDWLMEYAKRGKKK